jgi:hypothetical protein
MSWHANSLNKAYRDQKLESEGRREQGFIGPRSKEITNALAADLMNSGIGESEISIGQVATQAAGYRTRAYQWDLVVVRSGVPVAVVDWKLLGSPHNFNNRLDELVPHQATFARSTTWRSRSS